VINSRDLDELSLAPRKVCQAHIFGCKQQGIELLVTSTYRDSESQTELYAQGRTKNLHLPQVTKARAGESWHNYRCAWDVVPLVGGKCVWDTRNPLWEEVVRIGRAVGATHPMLWDMPHFEYKPAGLTLTQALDRFKENGTIFL